MDRRSLEIDEVRGRIGEGDTAKESQIRRRHDGAKEGIHGSEHDATAASCFGTSLLNHVDRLFQAAGAHAGTTCAGAVARCALPDPGPIESTSAVRRDAR